jgi:hypothetical protein
VASAVPGEIIVTARKTPVVIQAFSAAKLERVNVKDMYQFSQVAPVLEGHARTLGISNGAE